MSNNLKWLSCACCGKGFYGWQHYNRDIGFGICADEFCSKAYGYCTEGPKPEPKQEG